MQHNGKTYSDMCCPKEASFPSKWQKRGHSTIPFHHSIPVELTFHRFNTATKGLAFPRTDVSDYLLLSFLSAATRCTEPDLVIENGDVNVSRPIGIGSLATFGCDGNFVLEGPMTRVCGDAGWSGINPSCSE